ncbi:aspartate aminotransferase family protein [Mycobacterium sp. 21AC1]|uniref:aspartate aminotransferase family protein n=1 Tax=[Mycobacterium] appelbergii TaxID=2939269 RepID=UPI0029392C64|nr:aspartate aminotransferase family protein [Mycobacterium sp. 21AC1]MDV3124454.1 aspartate aminotransferase family protein [Mycobacterium sp. 21AC1]
MLEHARTVEATRSPQPRVVDRDRIRTIREREEARFARERPKSLEMAERARRSLLGGVPMNWMTKWPGGFPPFIASARGARLVDVDGNEYVDLCYGDTGAMAGHAPAGSLGAIADRAADGITFMLPTEDAIWVGEEMTRRFGVPFWQFALTATDANRFVLRLARLITGRRKVLVFNHCYHGSVDESLATLVDGTVHPRRGNIGPAVPPSETTQVVEFNDIDALERALAGGDVAAVLAEPALTNIGIVLPEPGFHDALRELTRRYGTLLVIDETHTICSGPGGYTKAHGLEPDFVTIGKSIGSGVPSAAYGFTADIAERIERQVSVEDSDVSGVGGTLAGNALSLAAIRATLANVLTEQAFVGMTELAVRLENDVNELIDAYDLPWHVTRLGCRVEYLFSAQRAHNGSEAAAGGDFEQDQLLHLYMLNRGVLLTPFHNMTLMSPANVADDVETHKRVLTEAIDELYPAQR